jgi:PST family polysaccharide transporter
VLNNFKQKVRSSTGKRLLSNFFSLSGIQMVSYLLPLITIPYLVRVLGVEKFGLIAFAQAIIQYFVIFTDYGFGLSATKQIAEHRENKNRVSEIFSSVLMIKMIMLVVSVIVLSIFIFIFDKFTKDWQLYYLTFGIVIGQSIFPIWYFQGIEKMHITALVNIVPKVIFTISIFIFVTSTEDYLYVPLINSLGFLLAGVVSLWLAIGRFKVFFKFPTFEQMKYQMLEGWHIFLGSISSNFSMLNITFFLGILTNPTMVGYYAAVEKIIRPLASLNRPVINAIFPHLSNTAKQYPSKAYAFSKKVSLLVSSIMLIVGVVLFVFSDTIVIFVFGEQFHASSMVLKIMAFIPMLHALIHIYAVPNMIIFNFKKAYSKIVFFGFVLSLVLSYAFIKLFSLEGAAFAALLTDIVVLSGMGLYLKNYLKFEKVYK